MSHGYEADAEALRTAARTMQGISAGLAETVQPTAPDAGSISEAVAVALEHVTRAMTDLSDALARTAEDLETTARNYDESDLAAVASFWSLHERP